MRFILFLFALSFNLYANEVNIIPKPNKIEFKSGVFVLNENTTVLYQGGLEEVSRVFIDYISQLKDSKSKVRIIDNVISISLDNKLNREAYILKISKNKVDVVGGSESGVFYAIQSIKQLIFNDNQINYLPALEIVDEPRFKWRSYMLDEARYFHGEKFVKRLLDQMALLKMNTFHWHLTNDAGWRIEIKKYPLLTKVGAFRSDSEVGTWKSGKTSGKPHGGFYTQQQIKEIVNYAAERHITIIPEISMPGHASAAIASYTWLGTAGVDIDVPIKFGRLYDNFDVTNPKVITFIKDVLFEVITLFPGEVIHIGGDEVGYKVWEESPHVQRYMREYGIKTPADLQIAFTNKISKFIEKHGKRMMGWNEILGKNIHSDFAEKKDDKEAELELAKNTIINFWKGELELVTDAAEKGYAIVNSSNDYTYLDHDYNRTSLKKAYSFNPVPDGLDIKYHKNIYGLGTQMWSEWTPTNEDVEYQTFPRIAALAEVAWTDINAKDFSSFRRSLEKMLTYWDELGINYASIAD
jgi:hexosaminidase